MNPAGLRLVTTLLLASSCQSVRPAGASVPLYPYGLDAGDDVMSCKGQKSCATGFVSTAPMHFFKHTFTKVNIYSNGYITMNIPFAGRQPKRNIRSMFDKKKMARVRAEGFAMIAPLWTDNDARSGFVFFQVYDAALGYKANATSVYQRAQRDVNYYSSHTNVNVSFVAVITWAKMLPRISYNPLVDKSNTFQLVLIQDPAKWLTFALFLYGETGWNNVVSLRANLAGYYVVGPEVEKYRLGPFSFKPLGLRLATKPGNRGRTGESFYKLSNLSHVPNYDHKCRMWYGSEFITEDTYSDIMSCPCNVQTAHVDTRWRPDGLRYPDGKTCFYERMPVKLSVQSCCYASAGYLLTRLDGSAGPTFRYHPRHYNHRKNDWEPHYWCCVMSHNCDKFYELRPPNDCSAYSMPYIAWMVGDPHIRTLDGVRYTFNGLGEYTLVSTKDMYFTLQARTSRARATDGSVVNATIVSAVAAKANNSEKIHVELNKDRTGLVIFVGYENQTKWHAETNIGNEKVFDGFTLSKENESSIIAAFSKGFTLTVSAVEGRLDLSLLAPVDLIESHTRGLFGVFDGQSDNDLTPRMKNGNSGTPLSLTGSDDRVIHYGFAETWRTPMILKLFYYTTGTSVMTYEKTNFRPNFKTETLGRFLSSLTSEQTKEVISTCQQNNECLFDLALTKNVQFAAATREKINNSVVAQNVLDNGNPWLEGPGEVNAIIGKTLTFTGTAKGCINDDGSACDIRNVTALPVGAVFNSSNGSASFTWTPRNMDSVALSFIAVGKYGGMSREEYVIVKMCGCGEHGACLFDELAYGQYYMSSFQRVACLCDIGWTGTYCEENFDGCADSPCTMGTTCNDAHPVEQAQSGKAFFCSQCPGGYTKNYEICVDVNECEQNTMNNCSQLCMNEPEVDSGLTSARVSCNCRAGYRLAPDGATCRDIDECVERTSGCTQQCKNTNGSYWCNCHGGFALTEKGHSCSSFGVDHCKRSPCRNGGTCTNYVTGYECFCAVGYTGKDCDQDASPCSSSPCINGATCQGNSVSYDCLCSSGYLGSRCEYELDECLSEPCENGGTCLDESGRYNCFCPEGFAGVHCQIRTGDPCSETRCQNGATCQPTPGSQFVYTCVCLAGYVGQYCERARQVPHTIMFTIVNKTYTPDLGVRSSSSYRTLANELKTELEAFYKATTKVGPYFLEITEIDFSNGSVVVNCSLTLRVEISQVVLNSILKQAIQDHKLLPHYELTVLPNGVDLCDQQPCQNDGICHANATNYKCICVAGFTGTNCETEDVRTKPQTAKPSKNDTGVIVGSVVGVLAALGIAAAGVFLYRRYRKHEADDMVEMVSRDDDTESTK